MKRLRDAVPPADQPLHKLLRLIQSNADSKSKQQKETVEVALRSLRCSADDMSVFVCSTLEDLHGEHRSKQDGLERALENARQSLVQFATADASLTRAVSACYKLVSNQKFSQNNQNKFIEFCAGAGSDFIDDIFKVGRIGVQTFLNLALVSKFFNVLLRCKMKSLPAICTVYLSPKVVPIAITVQLGSGPVEHHWGISSTSTMSVVAPIDNCAAVAVVNSNNFAVQKFDVARKEWSVYRSAAVVQASVNSKIVSAAEPCCLGVENGPARMTLVADESCPGKNAVSLQYLDGEYRFIQDAELNFSLSAAEKWGYKLVAASVVYHADAASLCAVHHLCDVGGNSEWSALARLRSFVEPRFSLSLFRDASTPTLALPYYNWHAYEQLNANGACNENVLQFTDAGKSWLLAIVQCSRKEKPVFFLADFACLLAFEKSLRAARDKQIIEVVVSAKLEWKKTQCSNIFLDWLHMDQKKTGVFGANGVQGLLSIYFTTVVQKEGKATLALQVIRVKNLATVLLQGGSWDDLMREAALQFGAKSALVASVFQFLVPECVFKHGLAADKKWSDNWRLCKGHAQFSQSPSRATATVTGLSVICSTRGAWSLQQALWCPSAARVFTGNVPEQTAALSKFATTAHVLQTAKNDCNGFVLRVLHKPSAEGLNGDFIHVTVPANKRMIASLACGTHKAPSGALIRQTTGQPPRSLVF